MDLTGDGGVLKKVLRAAKAADALQPSDENPIADVHYEGRLAETGEVFDSSREDGAVFTFEVGKGRVIRGWDIAVKTMKVGELAEVTCTADYAYGSKGSPPEIPPGATLMFEVELMAVRPPKGGGAGGVNLSKLDELRANREAAAAKREEEKKKREEAKAAAAARLAAKKQGGGSGGGKGGKGKK